MALGLFTTSSGRLLLSSLCKLHFGVAAPSRRPWYKVAMGSGNWTLPVLSPTVGGPARRLRSPKFRPIPYPASRPDIRPDAAAHCHLDNFDAIGLDTDFGEEVKQLTGSQITSSNVMRVQALRADPHHKCQGYRVSMHDRSCFMFRSQCNFY